MRYTLKRIEQGGGDEHYDYPFPPPYGGDMSNKILVVATVFAVVAIAVLIVPSSDDVDADSTKPFTVGDQTYITLSEAFDNVTDNGTISLNANASVDESTSLSDEKSITLDLNGFTLSTSKSITIGKDVSIILKDDSENGGGLFSSTKDFAINVSGNLELESGTMQSTKSTVIRVQATGTFEMTGGTINGTSDQAVLVMGTAAFTAGTIGATESAYSSYVAVKLSTNGKATIGATGTPGPYILSINPNNLNVTFNSGTIGKVIGSFGEGSVFNGGVFESLPRPLFRTNS